MAAPKSNGVLRTKLADMKVGDYIAYTRVIGTDGNVTFTQGSTGTEIDCYDGTNSDMTGNLFYFVKVDLGLLIADRVVVMSPVPSIINKFNLFKGSNFRCLTIDEYNAYIVKSDLNGNITPGDKAVWHSFPNVECNDNYQTLLEILQNKDNSRIRDPLSIAHLPLGFYDNHIIFSSGKVAGAIGTCQVGYRPAMEYVDNSRSTNIYY